jgi:hypothetical protein
MNRPGNVINRPGNAIVPSLHEDIEGVFNQESAASVDDWGVCG